MSKLASITTAIEEHQNKLQEQINEFQKSVQDMFEGIVREFFKEAPSVGAVVWNQYTPYFNDGEECTFNIYDVYFIGTERWETYKDTDLDEMSAYDFEGEELEVGATPELLARYERYVNEARTDEDSQYYQDRVAEIKAAMRLPESERAAIESIDSLIRNNEDIMKAMFGDHMTIYLTRDGIENYEYDHD